MELHERAYLIAKREISELVKQCFSIKLLSEAIHSECSNMRCSKSKQSMAAGSDISVFRAWDITMKIFPI